MLKNKLNCVPIIYVRYIDDSFLYVDKNWFPTILDVFNNYNVHIKFTHEIEVDKRINFLDITVIHDNNNFN